MKTLIALMIAVQLCHPFMESVFFTGSWISAEAGGFTCSAAPAHPDHAPLTGQQQDTPCHEDAPFDTPPRLTLAHPPVISTPISSVDGTLLPGYSGPIEIPPEARFTARG